MKSAYKTGDKEQLKYGREEMRMLKRKFGIRSLLGLLTVTQIPFIIIFYWTLMDICYDIENWPGVDTQGFL